MMQWTRLIVTRLANHVIKAKIMIGKNIGNVFYIPRMSTSPSQSPWPFKLIRRQFPFIVSYAMTINKSQGQSLASVGLYLPRPVFSHGQLYVAFSRVLSKHGLKILIHDKEGKPTNTTTNVVFKELFQNLKHVICNLAGEMIFWTDIYLASIFIHWIAILILVIVLDCYILDKIQHLNQFKLLNI